jgi:sugar-specific transcriptional regulator TrmB
MATPLSEPGKAGVSPRVALLHRRAELQRELAAVDVELAQLEDRADRANSPAGWISQRSSPLGKRGHLALWRRLRAVTAEGVRAVGKLRLIRADVFDVALKAADATRRRAPPAPSANLAAVFGVE